MKVSSQTFNPAKVAYYEKAGWEAYYAREWFLAFQLMIQLNREQFRMPLWTAILASIDIVQAKPMRNYMDGFSSHSHKGSSIPFKALPRIRRFPCPLLPKDAASRHISIPEFIEVLDGLKKSPGTTP